MIEERSALEMAADWAKIVGLFGMFGGLLVWCQQRTCETLVVLFYSGERI